MGPMGPMGFPWNGNRQASFMGMGLEMGMPWWEW